MQRRECLHGALVQGCTLLSALPAFPELAGHIDLLTNDSRGLVDLWQHAELSETPLPRWLLRGRLASPLWCHEAAAGRPCVGPEKEACLVNFRRRV